MKKNIVKRVLALFLASSMLIAASGCGSDGGNSSESNTSEQSVSSEGESSETEGSSAEAAQDGELAKVTIYPSSAAVPSGVVDGYKGKIFAKYGLQVEIWAYSDEKTNAILASQDLPDLMYVTYEQLETMIKGGMIYELDDLLKDIPLIADNDVLQTAFNYVRNYRSADTGKVYGIPIGTLEQVEGEDTGRNAIKVNWPVYYELGCPEVKDVWDLIPLMKQMMEAKPTADDGTKTWGTVLNSGTDGTYWRSSEIWYKWFGYEPDNMAYLIETDMVNGEYHNIIEEGRDSLYYEGLKFYNTAYREGVLDPDSINNDRETQKAKVETSKAVMVPSGSTPGWAGYWPIYMEGQKLYQENWSSPYGRDCFLVVNAKTSNLDACLKMIEVLADTDVFFQIWNGTEEEGCWYVGEDGLVYLTDYGFKQSVEQRASGTSTYFTNGEKQSAWMNDFIGDTTYTRTYRGPKGVYEGPNGERIAGGMAGWSEVREVADNSEEHVQWREHFGAVNFTELLKSKDAYTLKSKLTGVVSFCDTPDATMQLTLNAIRDVVVSASWKMVYAESDEEFEGYWDQMIEECKELGVDDIIQWRLEQLDKALETKESLEAK